MRRPKLRVLFACIGNSGRSIMAEAFAKHYGGENVDARSGGSVPLGHVLPGAIQVMREKGIDVVGYPSKGFDVEWITKECDLVVTMGCGDDACPAFVGKKMRDWELEDPKGKDVETFRRIRDEIERRVLALLQEQSIAPAPVPARTTSGLRLLHQDPGVHACRLPAEMLPQRLVHVADVLTPDLVRAERAPGVLDLEFRRNLARIQDLAQLIAEESECCGFLGFELIIPQEGDAIRLVIRAPSDAQPLLDAFAKAME